MFWRALSRSNEHCARSRAETNLAVCGVTDAILSEVRIKCNFLTNVKVFLSGNSK